VTPTIVELPALHLLGLRVVGKPKELGKLVPKGWRELQSRLPEIEGVKDPSKQIGFLIPKEHITVLGKLATFIGVEVSEDTAEPKGLRRHNLPASRYAQFEYVGSFLDEEFKGFYPGIFKAIGDEGLQINNDLGWIEMYDDATHNWDDKSDPNNVLRVLFPLLA